MCIIQINFTFVWNKYYNIIMLSIAERHKHILDKLNAQGFVKVLDIARELDVTPVTIRKDLKLLEEKKLLYRSHGGAIQIDPYIANRHVQEKEKQFPEEKKRIGMKAAEMLTPNDAIIIASGTTVLAFARCIPPEAQLTVLTSAMNVAMALLNCQQVEVIQLGGIVRHTSSSVTGEYALRMLENFSGTKLFLGVDGIDLKYGLTTTNFMEASVNRAMIDAAQKIIVLTDSSKFGRRGFGKICELDAVDQIITDSGVSPKVVRELE